MVWLVHKTSGLGMDWGRTHEWHLWCAVLPSQQPAALWRYAATHARLTGSGSADNPVSDSLHPLRSILRSLYHVAQQLVDAFPHLLWRVPHSGLSSTDTQSLEQDSQTLVQRPAVSRVDSSASTCNSIAHSAQVRAVLHSPKTPVFASFNAPPQLASL